MEHTHAAQYSHRSRKVGEDSSGGTVLDFYLPKGSARPPRIARGEGVTLIDAEGNRYLDASSGAVVCNIGHAHPRVVAAMKSQAERVSYAYPMYFESDDNVALSRRMCEMAGPGFERAFFVSGGSEANEAAIKLARQYAVASGEASRWKVLSRTPSYHGATLGVLGATGDAESEALFGPMMRVSPKVPAPLRYRLPNDVSDVAEHERRCADALEARIVAEGAETVLAFIMEPVGGVSTGALVSSAEYYRRVRQICSKYGVLLVHDEIMSGAGRTGRFLSSAYWSDSRPDIVSLAKGLAGGYTPFGAVLVRDAIVDVVTRAGGFAHGHTYVANPFSCAVARAVLDVVADEDLVRRAETLGHHLRQRLLGVMEESPIVGDVRGIGMLQAIELVEDRASKRAFSLEHNVPRLLSACAFARGVALYVRRANGGVYGDFVLIAPPLITTEAQVDEIAERLTMALQDVEGKLGVR